MLLRIIICCFVVHVYSVVAVAARASLAWIMTRWVFALFVAVANLHSDLVLSCLLGIRCCLQSRFGMLLTDALSLSSKLLPRSLTLNRLVYATSSLSLLHAA